MRIFEKTAIIFTIVIFTALAAFAKTEAVSLKATGYEWLGYSPEEKRVFAGILHMAAGQNKSVYDSEEVIKRIDDFYYSAIERAKKDPLNFDENESLKVKCISVITREGLVNERVVSR